MRILVDTNFWLIPFTCKVDVFSEFAKFHPHATILTMQSTLDELQGLQTDKTHAKHALALIKAKGVTLVDAPGFNVDEQIVTYAQDHDVVVATQDKELKRRVKAIPRSVMYLRKKQYVEMQ